MLQETATVIYRVKPNQTAELIHPDEFELKFLLFDSSIGGFVCL